MATDLGKVGIVAKGAWSSSATYEVLDAVYYGNGTYIAKQAVPANILPTNTTYWVPALTPSSEDYSTSGITLEYESEGATAPTYTISSASKITRKGNTVTVFLWFTITNVGSGTKLIVRNMPVSPTEGRAVGNTFGAALTSVTVCQAINDGTLVPLTTASGRIGSSDLSAGALIFGCTYGV